MLTSRDPSNDCIDGTPVPFAELTGAFRRAWRRTAPVDRLRWGVVSAALTGSNLAMIISFNFFLSSFTYGSPGYVSNLAPAVCWAVLYVAATAGLCLYLGERNPLWYIVPPKASTDGTGRTVSRRRDWSLLGTLVALGAADSWGGITGTYASPHVPIFLQTLLNGLGVVWTFILTRLFVPARPKPQLTRWSSAAFVCVILATMVAIIPQRDSLSTPSKASWIVVFLLAAILPVVYNVLQGRFLRQVDRVVDAATAETTSATSDIAEGSDEPLLLSLDTEEGTQKDATKHERPHPLVVKFVMLCFDSTIQVAIILVCCFVDFLPWFGNHPGDPHGTWVGLREGLACIAHRCNNTGWYFAIYTLSFWVTHIASAIMNHFSTTVTSFAMAVSLPLIQLTLWVFPALNVWGSHTPWPYILTCLGFTLAGTVLFLLASLRSAEKHHRTSTSGNEDSDEQSIHHHAINPLV